MKTTKLIQVLTVTAFILANTPAWSMGQDSGYPWYGDLPEKDRQTVMQPNKIVVAPVLPSEEDSGYPWFAENKRYEENPASKPVSIFKVHPNGEDGDHGYPWHADTKGDHSSKMVQ